MIKKNLFLFFFLISLTSFSQLTVRNTTYIFTSDVVFFVEGNVNLQEADATFYLRNEAQLIQGAGTETSLSKNSGVGKLSVYQNGNVGAYEHNNWCSPIGNTSSNTTLNNAFGISLLNNIDNITDSTPATYIHNSNYNGTANPLNIEPYWIWKFVAKDQYSGWEHVQGNTTINPGEGFSMKGTSGTSANNPGNNQNYDFRGKPNTGTIEVDVLDKNYTLVGNPYPSALDALAYIHDTENSAVITGTLFYWEQDPSVNSHYLNAYDGGSATYTIDIAGVPTYVPPVFYTYNGDGSINGGGSGIPSGKIARRYIPIGQGFMVEGKANGKVKAKNTHRVYVKETSSDSEFFKTSQNKKTNNEDFSTLPNNYKRFRLNIDFDNNYTRQLLKNFHTSATFGFDYGMEINLNTDDILASDAYFYNNSGAYIAEASPFDKTLEIPVIIKLDKSMPVRIRIADIQNFDNSQPIFLYDTETGIYYNLKNEDFEINLEAGTYNERFKITFLNKTLAIGENDDFVNSQIQVFQNNKLKQLTILNPNNLEIDEVSLYNIQSKLILKKQHLSNLKKHTFTTSPLSLGVYIVIIKPTISSKAITKKIIIKN